MKIKERLEMYVSDFVCHDHQCHAEDCGCTRNICPKHKAELTPSGPNMVCLYCDWSEPEPKNNEVFVAKRDD